MTPESAPPLQERLKIDAIRLDYRARQIGGPDATSAANAREAAQRIDDLLAIPGQMLEGWSDARSHDVSELAEIVRSVLLLVQERMDALGSGGD